MAPRALWVMRHAEKTGDLDDPHLSLLGQRRAAALVAWIPQYLGRPDMIFATAVSQHSQRPIETVQPLADALGLEIDDSFADQDYEALAKAISTEERMPTKRHAAKIKIGTIRDGIIVIERRIAM